MIYGKEVFMKNEEFNEVLLRERLETLKGLRKGQSKSSKKVDEEIRYLENLIISKVYRNEI